MDRQRLVNLLAAIAAITVFGFTFGLMFPLLSLITAECPTSILRNATWTLSNFCRSVAS